MLAMRKTVKKVTEELFTYFCCVTINVAANIWLLVGVMNIIALKVYQRKKKPT